MLGPTRPRLPCPTAAGVGGPTSPAPRMCEPGPEAGPVRADFTRQECAPPPPPRRGSRPPVSPAPGAGRVLPGSTASAVTTLPGRLPAPPRPAQPAQGPALGLTLEAPRPPHAPGRLAAAPAPRRAPKGAPSRSPLHPQVPGLPNPFSSRGRARGQSSSGRKPEPPCPLPAGATPALPAVPSLLRAPATQSCGRAGPSPQGDGRNPSKRWGCGGSLSGERRLSAGAGRAEGPGPAGRSPDLLRSSG